MASSRTWVGVLLIGWVLFAAAAGIVQFEFLLVANLGEIGGVKKRAVVGELRQLVSVAETTRGVAYGEGEVERFARSQRAVQRVDGVESAGGPADQVEWPVELDLDTDCA